MNLELKHLAPYLPYELKMTANGFIGTLQTICNDSTMNSGYRIQVSCSDWWENNNLTGKIYKPILRQLSDLTQEIEVNGDKFMPCKKLEKELLLEGQLRFGVDPDNEFVGFCIDNNCILPIHDGDGEILPECSWGMIEKLFEWHFDVFGLIQNGLAIDINTLNLS